MTTIQKYILGIVSLLVIITGIHSFGGKSAVGDATVSNYPTWYYNGIVIGPTNSLMKNIISGSCDLSGSTIVADRAVVALKCDVPTVKKGDHVFMISDQAGSEGNGPFPIIGAFAGVGLINVIEQNQTGGATQPDTSAITGVHYLIVR